MSGRGSSAAATLRPVGRAQRAAAMARGRAPSLAELAAQQGAAPVEDLDAVGELWPCDDDPEELLQHILAERTARRRLPRTEG